MEKGFSSLFQISVNFNQSHLFFPKIVTVVLLLLLVVILLVHGIPYLRDVRNGKRTFSFSARQMDKLRFGGTIALTIAYFLSMDHVGKFFPNMGLGFLFTSILFIFVLSLLYVHGLDRRKFLALSLNALIAPSLAWFVLAHLMNITLP
jgi:hypothetical protein